MAAKNGATFNVKLNSIVSCSQNTKASENKDKNFKRFFQFFIFSVIWKGSFLWKTDPTETIVELPETIHIPQILSSQN